MTFLGCPPPDPFTTPLVKALPLADQPHILQPNSRREDLFGMPRQQVAPHHVSDDGKYHRTIIKIGLFLWVQVEMEISRKIVRREKVLKSLNKGTSLFLT